MPDPAFDTSPQAAPAAAVPPLTPTPVSNPSPLSTKAEIFLKFNYPELKDLGKHFLTIASATAVFLLTFIDKLLGNNAAALKDHVTACMAALLVAIACAGIGLFTNYIAGSGASGGIIWGVGRKRFRALTICTYLLYMTAGIALFLAYMLLAYATMCR